MTIVDFAKEISKIGGSAFFVGGYVRDRFIGCESHDRDIVVVGVNKGSFKEKFPQAIESGNQFPVFRMELEGEVIEIAFARKEVSSGQGHNSFDVVFSPDITLEEDLFRRDLTMNSMAENIMTGEIIDPFKGKDDIRSGIIRATSSHFLEDPLRALRTARQAAKLDMSIDDSTIEMMHKCHEGIKVLSMERIVDELRKALSTDTPSIFFRELQRAKILDVCFPEIFRLIGQTQPAKYHPEGDAFEHTMLVLDAVASEYDSVGIRFAALMHDVGKGITPKELLPRHFGHDKAGVEIIENMPSQFPRDWKRLAILTSENHMAVNNMAKSGRIINLLSKAQRIPQGLECLRAVVRVDSGATPWFLEDEVSQALRHLHIQIPEGTEDVKGFVLNTQAHVIAKFKP